MIRQQNKGGEINQLVAVLHMPLFQSITIEVNSIVLRRIHPVLYCSWQGGAMEQLSKAGISLNKIQYKGGSVDLELNQAKLICCFVVWSMYIDIRIK